MSSRGKSIAPGANRRRRGRMLVGAVAAVAVVGGVIGGLIIGPNQASATTGDHIAGQWDQGEEHWVGYYDYKGQTAMCIDANRIFPKEDSQMGPKYSVTDPILGYLTSKHMSPSSSTNLADNDTAFAVNFIAHQRLDANASAMFQDPYSGQFAPVSNTAKARVNEFLAEAQRNAGPYTMSPVANLAKDSVGQLAWPTHGTVDNVGILSASGNWVPGYQVTLTASGPVVFDATGTNTLTVTSGSTPLSYSFHATSNATGLSVATAANGLPGITVFRSDSATHQNLAYPSGETLNVAGATAAFDARVDFQPNVVTKVSTQIADLGDAVTDELTVGLAAGDEWPVVDGRPVPVTFTGTKYAAGIVPPATSGSVPAGARALETVTLVADKGAGVYTSPAMTANESGFETWVWTVQKSTQPEPAKTLVRGDWSDSYGVNAETTSNRWVPDMSSELVPHQTKNGIMFTDQQWMSGFPNDHTTFTGVAPWKADINDVTQTLYFVPGADAPTSNSCSADRVIATGTTKAVNGYLEFSTNDFKVDPALGEGTYVLVHSFPGDDRVAPYQGSCTDIDQQFHFTPGKAIITTVAKSADDTPEVGEPIHDTYEVIVSGDERSAVQPGDYTVISLYTWPTGTNPVCTTPVWTSEKIAVTGAGMGKTAEYTPTTSGEYGYVEQLFDKNGKEKSPASECGIAAETITVKDKPAGVDITTQVKGSDDTPEVGEPIHDTYEITVTGDVATAVKPGDHAVINLYTWPTGSAPVCENPVWTSDPIAITGPGTGETATFTPTVAGEYGYVEQIFDADGNPKSDASECGLANETITVREGTIIITTVAKSQDKTPQVGEKIHDTYEITVTGDPTKAAAPGDYALIQLYHWENGSQPTCTNPVWTSEKIPVSGASTVGQTGTYTTTRSGQYGYVEQIFDANGKAKSTASPCGFAAETVTVKPAGGGLPLTGSASSVYAMAGIGLALAGAGALVIKQRRKSAAV